MPDRTDQDPMFRIRQLHADGLTPYRIAARLNAEQVPTPTGLLGAWTYASVSQKLYPSRHTAYQRAWRAKQR